MNALKFSYSRIQCYRQCPHKYWHKYINHTPVEEDGGLEPSSPLLQGQTVHKAIETGNTAEAMNEFRRYFYVINDEIEREVLKMQLALSKGKELFESGVHEVRISNDDWVGIVDYIDDYNREILDFKYTKDFNNVYHDGIQLNLYKHILGDDYSDYRIGYAIIPKCYLRKKKDESEYDFRKRIEEYYEDKEIKIYYVDESDEALENLKLDREKIISYNDDDPIWSVKRESRLCGWCEYKEECKRKDDENVTKE